MSNFADRTIWTGDNLDILRGLNSASVDLIYLDPPFNSNRNYAAPLGSAAAGATFKDTWTLLDLQRPILPGVPEHRAGLARPTLGGQGGGPPGDAGRDHGAAPVLHQQPGCPGGATAGGRFRTICSRTKRA